MDMEFEPLSDKDQREDDQDDSVSLQQNQQAKGNWWLSILLSFFAFAVIPRYFYLDSRDAWREKSQRAEFRFVAIATGIMSLGVMTPIILMRWWRAGGGDHYRTISRISWLVPATSFLTLLYVGGLSGGLELSGWHVSVIFAWEVLLIGTAIFAGLIPIGALESAPRQRKKGLFA